MDIVQDSAGHADHEDLQISPRPMLYSARNVNNHAFAQFDFFVIQRHPAFSANDIVNLVGPLVVMKFCVGDFEVMDFGRGAVRVFD